MTPNFIGLPTDEQRESALKEFESDLGDFKDEFNEKGGWVTFDFINQTSDGKPTVTWDIDRSKGDFGDFLYRLRESQR